MQRKSHKKKHLKKKKKTSIHVVFSCRTLLSRESFTVLGISLKISTKAALCGSSASVAAAAVASLEATLFGFPFGGFPFDALLGLLGLFGLLGLLGLVGCPLSWGLFAWNMYSTSSNKDAMRFFCQDAALGVVNSGRAWVDKVVRAYNSCTRVLCIFFF